MHGMPVLSRCIHCQQMWIQPRLWVKLTSSRGIFPFFPPVSFVRAVHVNECAYLHVHKRRLGVLARNTFGCRGNAGGVGNNKLAVCRASRWVFWFFFFFPPRSFIHSFISGGRTATASRRPFAGSVAGLQQLTKSRGMGRTHICTIANGISADAFVVARGVCAAGVTAAPPARPRTAAGTGGCAGWERGRARAARHGDTERDVLQPHGAGGHMDGALRSAAARPGTRWVL